MSDPQMVPGQGEFGVESQRLHKPKPRPDMVPPVLQDDAQVVVRRGQIGRPFNRLLETVERFVQPAERAIDRPQVAVKGGARGIE